MSDVRIKLRAVEPEDVDFLLDCESDRRNARWSDYRAPFSRNQLLTYALTYDADPFASGNLRLVIETEDKNRVGILDLYNISDKDSKAYIGICIHSDFRRQKYGISALNELIIYARERLGLNQLVAKVAETNLAGLQLFTTSGFISIATLPSWHRIGSCFHAFRLLHLPL